MNRYITRDLAKNTRIKLNQLNELSKIATEKRKRKSDEKNSKKKTLFLFNQGFLTSEILSKISTQYNQTVELTA